MEMIMMIDMEQVKTWMSEHGLPILITVVMTLVLLKVIAIVTRKVFGFLSKDEEDAEANKLGQTIISAVRWTLAVVIVSVASVIILRIVDET